MAGRDPEDFAADERPTADGAEKLPLLSLLGRSNSSPGQTSGGFVGTLIAGSTALAVALMAFTIAFGRAPVDSPAAAATVEGHAAFPTTVYASPTPTGPRWTPEPIIMGVPQKEAPAESPTTQATPSASDDDETDERQTPEPDETWPTETGRSRR